MKLERIGILGPRVRGFLLWGLLFGAAPALAQELHAQTAAGDVWRNSSGECWQAAGGMPSYCDEIPDSDGDGVTDDRDRCPDTPAGATVGETGCPPDADRDGVADIVDQCPDTPYGVRVDGKGCALDLDGDGVPYYRDRCCQRIPPGAEVDAEGCLYKVTLEDVHFAFDRSDLTQSARQILQRVVGLVADRDDVTRILVSGHTDSIGSSAYNQGLSERRAWAVVQYLQRGGVNKPIDAAGYGETSPATSNDSDSGRARNRRVEIVLEQEPEMRREY